MSATTTNLPPFQPYYPSPYYEGNDQILAAIERVAGENRMTTVTADAASRQAAADIARDIIRAVDYNGSQGTSTTERANAQVSGAVDRNGSQGMATTERVGYQITSAVDRNGSQGMATTERVGYQLASAVDRNGSQGMSTTERVNAQLAAAVDRNGSQGMAVSERVGYQVGSAVERNGANAMASTERVGSQLGTAVERNGGNIMTAVERVAGENRLTTITTDAANRQAQADSARDLAVSIERNGANTVQTAQTQGTLLLSTIERNAGEGRVTTVTATGQLDAKLTDVRHSILNDINRSNSDILAASTQNLNVLSKGISDSAWETRTALTNGFSQSIIEQIKGKNDLAMQSANQYASNLLEQQKTSHDSLIQGSNHYSSLLLEQQKMKEYLSSKGDTHFSINQLEQQKVKEYLSSKTDSHYSSLLLEQQKSKSELANLASTHFSINQLEQQKIKECLSAQLAEAKYEALKSQQYLADKIGDCCCEVKQKIDHVDRDRLRDHLSVANNDNNLLKVLEFTQGFRGYDRGYDRGYHRHDHHYDDRDRGDRGRGGDDRR
jgi:hypothetical protein